MLNMVSKLGLKSDHLIIAGLASIVATFAIHFFSRAAQGDSKAQADRWGIFIGEWAPSFFALGTALKLEEKHR